MIHEIHMNTSANEFSVENFEYVTDLENWTFDRKHYFVNNNFIHFDVL